MRPRKSPLPEDERVSEEVQAQAQGDGEGRSLPETERKGLEQRSEEEYETRKISKILISGLTAT